MTAVLVPHDEGAVIRYVCGDPLECAGARGRDHDAAAENQRPLPVTGHERVRGRIESGFEERTGAREERFAHDGAAEFRLLTPFLNLGNRDYLPKRLTAVFSEWGIPEEEMRSALDAGFSRRATRSAAAVRPFSKMGW